MRNFTLDSYDDSLWIHTPHPREAEIRGESPDNPPDPSMDVLHLPVPDIKRIPLKADMGTLAHFRMRSAAELAFIFLPDFPRESAVKVAALGITDDPDPAE